MSGSYNYNLKDTVEIDISQDQAEELIQKWYVHNVNAGTYDLYEEIYENVEYIHFEYEEEKEVEVRVLEIEIYETKKVKHVSYKTKEKWFLWFFKNIAQKFFPKKELNVSEERIKQLEVMVSKEEIFDLEIQEKVESGRVVKKVSEKEMLGIKTPYTFLRETNEKKMEKQKVIHDEECSVEEFEAEFSDKEIISEERYMKKKLKEKIVVDRRKIITITQIFYIPGIWSSVYNHTEGTKATFNGRVEITYISWFNPYDSAYVDIEAIKENIIEIIDKEQHNIEYIRWRFDRKDGFNIEETRIN